VDTGSVVDLVQSGGMVTLLIVILLGGVKKWWVVGWQYQREVDRADKWERLALEGTDLAERGTETAHQIAQALQLQVEHLVRDKSGPARRGRRGGGGGAD
jgi:hypothetical protein